MSSTFLNSAHTRQERIEALGYDYIRQPKIHLESCNLCRASCFVVLTHRDRYGYAGTAMLCRQCGLVFLNPVMTMAAYADFYRDIYRPLVSAYHGRLIDADTIQDEQRLYAVQLGDFMASCISDGDGVKSLLDIGGSTGVVAHSLAKRFGFSCTLLDPSPLEVEKAKALGLETVEGLLETYEPEGHVYDWIILCQTIDHLLDITESLQKIKQLLASEGWFFVDFVDLRAVYLRHADVGEAIKMDHPYYLTEAVMESYLARAGFAVVRKNYAPDGVHIGYLCRHANPQPDALPSSESVSFLLREIRQVQNLPKLTR